MSARLSHDVVIAGARCAGSATALLLARMGHDVALIDRSVLPSDTLSTHAIARSGVVQLSRWGLLEPLLATGAPAIRTVGFGTGGDLTHRTVKPTAGVDLLIAPRRYVLDTLLREAAAAAGATVYAPATVGRLTRHPSGQVSGLTIRDRAGGERPLSARLVVGADGLRSSVAGEVDAARRTWATSPSGTFYTYVRGLDTAGFEFHVAARALVGVFPTHDDEACIWLCAADDALQPLLRAGRGKAAVLWSLIADATPNLGARLRATDITAPVRGAVNLPNQIRRPTGPGWALVGDAGYHRDPITGHGISDAFRDAEFVARAIDRHLTQHVPWSVAGQEYDRARAVALHDIFAITQALARFPGAGQFIALQKHLSDAIEREALLLAALPALGTNPALVP